MLALTRGTIPMVESINGEIFVGRTVPAKFEMLLLLAHAKPKGMNRTAQVMQRNVASRPYPQP